MAAVWKRNERAVGIERKRSHPSRRDVIRVHVAAGHAGEIGRDKERRGERGTRERERGKKMGFAVKYTITIIGLEITGSPVWITGAHGGALPRVHTPPGAHTFALFGSRDATAVET